MLVGAFNQEEALVGAFSLIVKTFWTFVASSSRQRSVYTHNTFPDINFKYARANALLNDSFPQTNEFLCDIKVAPVSSFHSYIYLFPDM